MYATRLLSLTDAIAGIDREITMAAETMDGYDGFGFDQGIGSRAAAVFLSSIGNVDDFGRGQACRLLWHRAGKSV